MIDVVRAGLPGPAVAMCGTPSAWTKHLSSHAAEAAGLPCCLTGATAPDHNNDPAPAHAVAQIAELEAEQNRLLASWTPLDDDDLP
ncbi:hypothetical protein [Methyloversatilis sp.]|uniref:hypothetical protein n=1 Tax=Methyloversatilis sp. TaxID=2569862 RepID=UPI0027337CE9|nr:hypothetical protein [Methyloversatilis sp.]